VNWACEQFALQPDDTFSSHVPNHFDLSTFDLFAAASAGGTVSVVPGVAALFPVRLAQWIGSEEVTVWYSVPSALSMLVRYGGLDQHPLDSVRLLLFASEVFPNKYLAELMRLAPRARFFNLYGPTETNVCAFHEVVEPPAAGDPPMPIGRPCANTRCLVEDEAGNVVSAAGVEGELVVRGSIVAQGYWGNPARTAQGFPAPYTYRTGDVVQWSDGPQGRVLRFVGRRDHMVKSRGYRIELGEIETALYAQVDVEEAAAVAVPDELLGSRILAFCVAAAALDEDKLKRLCRERLPQYMVPERIVLLERLPRIPTARWIGPNCSRRPHSFRTHPRGLHDGERPLDRPAGNRPGAPGRGRREPGRRRTGRRRPPLRADTARLPPPHHPCLLAGGAVWGRGRSRGPGAREFRINRGHLRVRVEQDREGVISTTWPSRRPNVLTADGREHRSLPCAALRRITALHTVDIVRRGTAQPPPAVQAGAGFVLHQAARDPLLLRAPVGARRLKQVPAAMAPGDVAYVATVDAQAVGWILA
jgi:AMP-binding enzyme